MSIVSWMPKRRVLEPTPEMVKAIKELNEATMAQTCPFCGAPPQEMCISKAKAADPREAGPAAQVHTKRIQAAHKVLARSRAAVQQQAE